MSARRPMMPYGGVTGRALAATWQARREVLPLEAWAALVAPFADDGSGSVRLPGFKRLCQSLSGPGWKKRKRKTHNLFGNPVRPDDIGSIANMIFVKHCRRHKVGAKQLKTAYEAGAFEDCDLSSKVAAACRRAHADVRSRTNATSAGAGAKVEKAAEVRSPANATSTGAGAKVEKAADPCRRCFVVGEKVDVMKAGKWVKGKMVVKVRPGPLYDVDITGFGGFRKVNVCVLKEKEPRELRAAEQGSVVPRYSGEEIEALKVPYLRHTLKVLSIPLDGLTKKAQLVARLKEAMPQAADAPRPGGEAGAAQAAQAQDAGAAGAAARSAAVAPPVPASAPPFDTVEDWWKWLGNARAEGKARVLAGVKGVPYSQLATARHGQRGPKKLDRIIVGDYDSGDRGYDKGNYGYTALHQAVVHDHDIVEALLAKLLDHGADINARDNKGETPLIAAAGFGERLAVRTLLRRGADPTLGIVRADHLGNPCDGDGDPLDAKAARGKTALNVAVAYKDDEWQECALALLERAGTAMQGGWDGPWEEEGEDGDDEDDDTFDEYVVDFGAEYQARIAKAKTAYARAARGKDRANKRRRTRA